MKDIVDILYAIGLFINAMVFLAQAYKIKKARSCSGVSLLTFVGFNIVQVFYILNGILFHDPDLIYGTIPSLITCQILIWLIIYYRYFYQAQETQVSL